MSRSAAAGTITLGSGGNVTLGSGGTVTLGSGGTIIDSTGTTVVAAGGTYTFGPSGGNITLGSGGNVVLGSGGNVTLGSGGTIALGSGGNITLGSGGNVTLGSGGNIVLGSGGNVTLGSGGNVTLGSGGTVTLGSGGNVTLGSGGNVTLGSGGNVTLGSGGDLSLGSGGNVTLGSGGTALVGAGGVITVGSAGGNVTLGSGGNVTLGSGGTITLGSGGNIVLGSGGNVTLGSGGATINGTPESQGTYFVAAGGNINLASGGNVTLGSGGNVTLGSGGTIALGSGGNVTLGSGGNVTLGSGGNITLGSGGTIALGSGGNVTLGSGGTIALGSGGNVTLGSGGNVTLGSGGNVTLGSGGALTNELTYETANSVVRPPSSPTETQGSGVVRVDWMAPAFGVVQTYAIYRSSDGATPILIGSVSGNPPATEFIDTNPDTTATTVMYTITTILVPDASEAPRQSPASVPAVVKNDQTIVLAPLPSSVPLSQSTVTVSATTLSGGNPNGLQVNFSATGSCSVGSQSVASIGAGGASSATINLSNTGSCTITASQPGTDPSQSGAAPFYNAASAVSGSFAIVAQNSSLTSQTINWAPLPNKQYGNTFSLSATASSGETVSFLTSGPCHADGTITGIGICKVTASAPGDGTTVSPASVTQSFTIFPAVLKVTADNLSISFGQPLPLLTYKYSGFVNNESASVVSGAPVLSTTATTASIVGNYPITVSTGTLAAANYSFLYVTGTLAIQQASQSIAFTTNPPASAAYNSTFTVAASSTSLLPVTFTSGGACTNVGATYSMTNSTGTCSVIANQAGNTNYAAAVPVTKTVTATGPMVSLSTSAIDFGTVYFGSITTKTITVRNIGNAPVTIKDPLLSVVKGGNSNEFVAVNLCLLPLAAGKSCTITIAFVAGPYYTPQTAALQIVDNAPGSPQAVTLTALVINPLANFSPTSLSFGTVKHGTSSTLNVTLSNPGGTPLVFSGTGISVTGTSAKSFVQTNNCGSSLAAGTKCSIAIKFTPATTGTFTANLSVVDNAQAGGGTQTVPLSGKGN